MNLVKEICEVENELRGLVYLEQFSGGISFKVSMRNSFSTGQGYEVLKKISGTLSEYTCSARHDADEEAFRKTEAFVEIAKDILKSPMENATKIALFSRFNIMGYMFDRTVQNYLACNSILQDFLDCLDEFKKNLKAEELVAWNSSTYGGESQVMYLSGMLQGICLVARCFDREEMIDPYKKIKKDDAEVLTEKEDHLSVADLIRESRSIPGLSINSKKDVVFKGESIANSSDDYLMIGAYASHDDCLSDKSLGRKFFEISFKKSISGVNAQINNQENFIDASEIANLALEVSVPAQLNDKVWARELFEIALNHDTIIGNLNSMADTVASPEVLNDKVFARRILEKAWNVYSSNKDSFLFNEIVFTCGLLAHEDVGNEKLQAEKWINELQDDITDPEDYLILGFFWGHEKTMNNKLRARSYFVQALRELEDSGENDSCLPYHVALKVIDSNILNDLDWAVEICEKYFQHIRDYETLIGMSSIAFQKNKELACMILRHMEQMIDDDEYASSDDYILIASHVSDKRLNNHAMFEDKEWGKQLFEKALEKAETEDKEKILKAMSKHL